MAIGTPEGAGWQEWKNSMVDVGGIDVDERKETCRHFLAIDAEGNMAGGCW